jgi:hypothetical protein
MPTLWREPSAPGETTHTHHRTAEDGECALEIEEPGGVQRYGITPLARRQLAEKLTIRYAYFERMRTEQPELLDRNVNVWLERDEGERQLLRTLDGKVPAVDRQRGAAAIECLRTTMDRKRREILTHRAEAAREKVEESPYALGQIPTAGENCMDRRALGLPLRQQPPQPALRQRLAHRPIR